MSQTEIVFCRQLGGIAFIAQVFSMPGTLLQPQATYRRSQTGVAVSRRPTHAQWKAVAARKKPPAEWYEGEVEMPW